MALTQTLAQMRGALRRLCDIEGASFLARHPDADCNDYINRGLGALRRRITQALPDQRILSSTTVNTAAGTSTYALPGDFEFLISVDVTAYGTKTWLDQYSMSDRASLTSPDVTSDGAPYAYRLRGANIEFLPVPAGVYTATLWYVPDTSQLATDGATLDTVQRLDDYVLFYAGRFVAKKDSRWDLHDRLTQDLAALDGDVLAMGRRRDGNAAPKVNMVRRRDRFGRLS